MDPKIFAHSATPFKFTKIHGFGYQGKTSFYWMVLAVFLTAVLTPTYVTAAEVCNSVGASCPESTCCRQDVCDREGTGGKCCDQATLDAGDLTCAFSCAKCIDCNAGPWSDCNFDTCKKNGMEPETVKGTKSRKLLPPPGPGGKECTPEIIDGKEYMTGPAPCTPKNCPENCLRTEWSGWGKWSRTVKDENENEVQCGVRERTRSSKQGTKYEGKTCEEMYPNCSGDACFKEEENKRCPDDPSPTPVGGIIGGIIAVVVVVLAVLGVLKAKHLGPFKCHHQIPTVEGGSNNGLQANAADTPKEDIDMKDRP